MKIKESTKIFLAKLQGLPESQKKIILWVIVVILGLIMGYFWINSAINNFSKIGESVNSIKIPVISELSTNTPATNTFQSATPTK